MIYDCFMFANEVELLKLRLTELWDVVDKFVLVESRETHRGAIKPLYYSDNKGEFAQWSDKVDAIVIDSFGIKGDTVEINKRREAMARLAHDGYAYRSDSVIVYGDADEIVKPSVIHEWKECKKIRWCEMRFHHYFFNCVQTPTPDGARPVIAPLAIYKEIGFNRARWTHGFSLATKAPMIPKAGWHFTNLGNVEALKEKISWAVEGFASDWIFKEDPALIQERINNGQLYNGAKQFQFVPIDEKMPKYVRDNEAQLAKDGLIRPMQHAFPSVERLR